MSRRRALVTGGAGFIGSHLVDALLAEGWEVCVLDDLSSGSERNLAHARERVQLLRGDVRDPELVSRAADGARVIFHLAAVASVPASVAAPVETGSVNVEGTLRILEAARAASVERVVLASSCAVYGDSAPLPIREDAWPDPASPYAVQKVAAEHYARLYLRLHGVAAVSLRYFNVYGPRQNPHADYAAAVPCFARDCLEGRAPRIYGDGGQTRDFVYVEDVVRANLGAATSPDAVGLAINVASGVETSVNALAGALAEITGSCKDPVHAPARPGDVRRSVADVSLARRRLGFEPRVDLREGLRRTVQEIRARGATGGIAA